MEMQPTECSFFSDTALMAIFAGDHPSEGDKAKRCDALSMCVCLSQYEQLDEEHKGLFKGIFDVAAANDAGSLSSLSSKVKSHFATEEVSTRHPLLSPLFGAF